MSRFDLTKPYSEIDLNDIEMQDSASKEADPQRGPLPIVDLFQTFYKLVKKYGQKENKWTALGTSHLHKLYAIYVFGAKDNKAGVPVFNEPGKPPMVDGKTVKIEGLASAAGIKFCTGTVCLVFKGSPTESFRSCVVKLEDKTVMPVVSYKVFQALISIVCCRADLKKLNPAPLCARAFSCYETEEKEVKEKAWRLGISGHAGLNFVAQYVFIGAKKLTVCDSLPTFTQLVMLAYKADQVNPSRKKAADKKKNKKKKKKTEDDDDDEEDSMFEAIIRSCQIPEETVVKMMKHEKMKVHCWVKEPVTQARMTTSKAKSILDSILATAKSKAKESTGEKEEATATDEEEEEKEESGAVNDDDIAKYF